jgi:hypothetical protein
MFPGYKVLLAPSSLIVRYVDVVQWLLVFLYTFLSDLY